MGNETEELPSTWCHEHRPRDGYGDQLAEAIANDWHWEAPPDHTPGRDTGDGYSPMLWRLLERWLHSQAVDPLELAWALESAIERCPTACKNCKARGTVGNPAVYLARCQACEGTGRTKEKHPA
jgi:hypothetical protein